MKFHDFQPQGWNAEHPSPAKSSWYQLNFSVACLRKFPLVLRPNLSALTLLLFALSFVPNLSAQSLHRQFLGGLGGTFVSDQVTYRWTAGEMAVRHLASANGQHRLTEGFQQPELMLLSTEEYPFPLVELAPNPVANLLRIRALQVEDQALFLRLVDGQGRVLLAPQPLAGFRQEIDFTSYPEGIYLVQIIDRDQRQVQVQKIIKANY